MKVFISTDVTVFKQNNRIYAQEKHATIIKRYYDAFGKIVLCSRVKKISNCSSGIVDITEIIDETLEISSLFKMLIGKYKNLMINKISGCDFVVSRCPSISAYCSADCALKLNKPYLAESMGCAWDAYWNHGFLGKIIAPYMYFRMKYIVKNANYALYVTERFLQKRYPCLNESVSASNVLINNIDESVLKLRIARMSNDKLKQVTLMTTAAIDVPYKGQEYVIRAISELNKKGISVLYNIVGEGSPEYLKGIAKKYGVAEQVNFIGRIPLNSVLELLDTVDIYIQPSLQEGLPRSVIEAMSRGCICVGANTAGIPELLENDFVIRKKSVSDIVSIIQKYCNMTYDERCCIANRNFNEAKKYQVNVLNKRREEYFKKIVNEIGERNA